MMYTIRVSDGGDKGIAKWKKSNPNLFKRYKKIYKELLEHPKTALGQPEQLMAAGETTPSRHTPPHHRLVHDIPWGQSGAQECEHIVYDVHN